jgi:IMP cyclohydrolase
MLNSDLKDNYARLKSNVYPGRGIIIGMTPNSKMLVQVYWIMGRSENSRNRIFEADNGYIRTKAYDESKMTDPSLIIYYPVKQLNGRHIVTNGDQTDTIYETLKKGGSFEDALNTRYYEPDGPNFTPRISGIIGSRNDQYAYKLSIVKAFRNTEASCLRQYFNYEKGIGGVGHCIHTYSNDGNPLPSFTGDPYELELFDDIDKTVDCYWSILNEENRVSILAKYVNMEDGSFDTRIINRNI